MISTLAPIVLFVFARPKHTLRTLEALASNTLAKQSDLIVYADAARNESEAAKVRAVRNQVNSTSGFRSITVIERTTNYGLARNIIEGVTEVCNRYDRVIVLEDDMVTSPDFLSFMNASLERYADNRCVWHISGWNYPIDPVGLGDAFFWRVMNCWGWATWDDRWQNFKKDPQRLLSSWSGEQIKRFNLNGAHDFWKQVKLNSIGHLNTWAIFWYATIFENNGLCLNPSISLVQNIGHDGTGQNCEKSELFSGMLKYNKDLYLPSNVIESEIAVDRIRRFYKRIKLSLFRRVLRKLRRIPICNKL